MFESAIEDGRWGEALDLYRGNFLRGFHVSEAWGFEDWVETERDRLREKAAGAAWSLAHEQVDRGALVEAERTAQRALNLVWSDETPLRRFIEALAKAGDGSAALNLYERFCCKLREELELEPSQQTASVAEAIRNGELEASGANRFQPDGGLPGEIPPPSPGPEHPSVEESADPLPTPRTPTPRRRVPVWAFAAVTILTAAFTVYVVASRDTGPELNPSLVVLPPFENRTGDPEFDVSADMAAEWVAEAVQQVKGVVLVPLSDTRQIVAGLVEDGSADLLRRVAERTGAGWVISGVMTESGGSVGPWRTTLTRRWGTRSGEDRSYRPLRPWMHSWSTAVATRLTTGRTGTLRFATIWLPMRWTPRWSGPLWRRPI